MEIWQTGPNASAIQDDKDGVKAAPVEDIKSNFFVNGSIVYLAQLLPKTMIGGFTWVHASVSQFLKVARARPKRSDSNIISQAVRRQYANLAIVRLTLQQIFPVETLSARDRKENHRTER